MLKNLADAPACLQQMLLCLQDYDLCFFSGPWELGSHSMAVSWAPSWGMTLPLQAKYSGQDPYLALLPYCSTPVDAHMHSPGEMLYQCALCTTVPQHIYHTDLHGTANHDHLDQHASLSTGNHDCQGCLQKVPLFAGQTISILNDARCLWLPATIIHAANHGLYIVQVISSGQY